VLFRVKKKHALAETTARLKSPGFHAERYACARVLLAVWPCFIFQLRRSVADGEVGEDALEDLINMLADRFPSVVGERRRES